MTVRVHTQVTHQEADSIGYTPYWKKYAFAASDLDDSNAYAVPIPPESIVLAVALLVIDKFDNSVHATVGDSGDADEFITSTDCHSSDATFVTSLGLAADAKGGKYYASADRMVVTFSDTPTEGTAELCILFSGMEV